MTIASSYHLVPSTLSSFQKSQLQCKNMEEENWVRVNNEEKKCKNGILMQAVFSRNSVCT